jgi:hypothetical protein
VTGHGHWLHGDPLTEHPSWSLAVNLLTFVAAWPLLGADARHVFPWRNASYRNLLLSAVMAIEKTSQWGRVIVAIVGAGLLLWGV